MAEDNEVNVALTDRETTQVQRLLGDPTVYPQIMKNWVTSWTQQDMQIALNQIQGWADYVAGQQAKDSAQDTSITANTAGVNSLNSGLATTNSNVTANSNSITTLNSQMATATAKNTTQDGRLTALEAAGGGVSVYWGYDGASASSSTFSSTWAVPGSGPQISIAGGSYLAIFGCRLRVPTGSVGYFGLSVGGSDPTSEAQAYIQQSTLSGSDGGINVPVATAAVFSGSGTLKFMWKPQPSTSSVIIDDRWIAALKYA